MSTYINEYAVTLCYGGPEEGGWWFPQWEQLNSVRIRGRLNSREAATQLNRYRVTHGFHSSRSKAYQTRHDRGGVVRHGATHFTDEAPQESAERFWSSLGVASSSIGAERMVTIESHPAQNHPVRRPVYE